MPLGFVGCDSTSSVEPVAPISYAGVELSVAAVGDPAILSLANTLKGEWEQRTGATVLIQESPLPPDTAPATDLILYSGQSMGDLVDQSALAEFPEALLQPPSALESAETDEKSAAIPDDDPVEYRQVAAPFRDEVTRYGETHLGLALGSSALVLVYRNDVLANPSESLRSEAEQAGVALSVPRTWEELDALARFLNARDWNADGQPDHGIALPLGPDTDEQVGLALFLARTASLGLHPDFYSFLFSADTLEPWVTRPPFVESLTALVSLQDAGPPEMATFDIAQARDAFRQGRVALLIDRAEKVHEWVDREQPFPIGVAALPGSNRVYEPSRQAWEEVEKPNTPTYLAHGGGWLVGVSTTSPHPEAARDFARYLIESETAQRVRANLEWPMLPVRGRLIAQGPTDVNRIPGVDRGLWSEAVSSTFLSGRVALGLRIPEADGYLDDLNRARVDAVKGTSGPLESLEKAAELWRARTKHLGIDRQIWHYRRSLNAFVSNSEPPPRP